MTQSPLGPYPLVAAQEAARQGTRPGHDDESEELALSKVEVVGEAAGLGLRELCHDLQQEIAVMECLVARLVDGREPLPLESALGAQVRLLSATILEARMPSAPRRLPLRPLVTEAVETARLLYRGVIQLEASSEGEVEGVATEVRRALVNLLASACRAAPDGAVRVTVADEDDDVLLEVEDDGTGAEAAGGGGLGMAVVRDVARRHGGRLTRRAGSSGGTAVSLRLPRLGV